MAIALNTALLHIKDVCAAISGMHAERVHSGPILPSRVSTDPHITIVMDKNRGDRIDGGKTTRQVKLTIGAIMRIDPVSQDPDIQINETYEPMHAALEALADGVAGKIVTLTEVEDSVEYETQVINEQQLRIVSSEWLLTFDRTLGQTDLAS